MNLALFATLASTLLLVGCRKSVEGRLPLLPERIITEGDATAALRWGPDRPVNFATQTLFVQLDHLPEARAGAAVVPTCLEWLPDDFALGYVQCEPSGEKIEILAGQVRQSCLAQENSKDPAEDSAIELDCNLADVFRYKFEPDLTFGVSGPTSQ